MSPMAGWSLRHRVWRSFSWQPSRRQRWRRRRPRPGSRSTPTARSARCTRTSSATSPSTWGACIYGGIYEEGSPLAGRRRLPQGRDGGHARRSA